MLKRIWKGLKNFVDKKVKACAEFLSVAKNRVVLGVIIVGTGIGLIASGYVKVPE